MLRLKILWTIGILGLAGLSSFGQTDPRQTAVDFFQSHQTEVRSNFTFERTKTFGSVIVFESIHPQGFVLVRKNPPNQILGYSLDHPFFLPNDSIPETAQILLKSLDQMTTEDLGGNLRMKPGTVPIEPMLQTHWSQDDYFNYFCPKDELGPNERVWVGCTAVAMGQILRYFGRYNNFFEEVSMNHWKYGQLSATVGGYDWERMENVPEVIDPAVSRFLSDLGIMLHMDYGGSRSSTSNYLVYNAFKQLKYFDARRMQLSATYADMWEDTFVKNIQYYQPIYVAGSGHAWVCDGMDENGLFHFNLGWGGYGDGYYPLSTVRGLMINEMIANLEPSSRIYAPIKIIHTTLEGKNYMSWSDHPFVVDPPEFYRVYLNDSTFITTFDNRFCTDDLPAGVYKLMVTSFYQLGESRQAGPFTVRIHGEKVNIPDPVLRKAINKELAVPDDEFLTYSPRSDELLAVRKIQLDHSVNTLQGIDKCSNLQAFILNDNQGGTLDLEPLSKLRRLKWISIGGFQSENLEVLTNNHWINHIELSDTPLPDLEFLNGMPDLLELLIHRTPVTDLESIRNSKKILVLALDNCQLQTMDFILDLPLLEDLDLSHNQISRIRIFDHLNHLLKMNLSANQINETGFLSYFPRIEHIDLSHNQLTKYITGHQLNQLKILDISSNNIDSLNILVPYKNVTRFNASFNHIRSLVRLDISIPSSEELNLSNNLLHEFNQGTFQQLQRLNLANNEIDMISGVGLHPRLISLDLSGNRITDLHPLTKDEFFDQLDLLNVDKNPLSQETHFEIIPWLSKRIDTLLLPENYQIWSPCYPTPPRESICSTGSVLLNWTSPPLPSNCHFDLFLGKQNEPIQKIGELTVPGYQLDIDAGSTYYWFIRTVLPDTSYSSGLYSFKSYSPIQTPYIEGFESFSSLSRLTENSFSWIKTQSDSTLNSDAFIDSNRSYEGNNSLKIISSSEVRLPLNHLTQHALSLDMRLLIEKGRIGACRIDEVLGKQIAVYFKSDGKFDIVVDGEIIGEYFFPQNRWFRFEVLFSSISRTINIKLDRILITTLQWTFPMETVRVDGLEFSGDSGPGYPWDGYPLFYVDQMEIRSIGSTGIDPAQENDVLHVYPNPASNQVYLDIPSGMVAKIVSITDIQGRLIKQILNPPAGKTLDMGIISIPKGLYFIRLQSNNNETVIPLVVK